jgi:nucleotide-binding universal stress UspA family protein
MNAPPAKVERESQGGGPPGGPAIDLYSILAPVDFSPASRHGLAFAAALAGRFDSKIQLMHVVEPPTLPEWGYAHIPQREARLRQAAAEKLPLLPGECGLDAGLVQSVQVRSGEAGGEICQAAAEWRCDLIVLASHGLGGLRHAFFGSTAESVVRRAPCPVLTVRDRALRKKGAGPPDFDLKRIVVTTDFSEESRKAFPYAVALARKFEASLVLLYVVPAHLPAELSHIGFVLEERRLLAEARERMPRFRQTEFDPHLPMDALVLNGAPAHEICRTAETQAADLIIMATHGHAGLKHFLVGSVAENVVRHAPCPVLVVRDREHDFVKA